MARYYEQLSDALSERMIAERRDGTFPKVAFLDENVIRRNMEEDKANAWRPAFIRDCDKIMHCPYYNRYADKTQVFSFYKNDDITRRGLHVQLVSRTARTIGYALNLNLELIEAIALGHDIGHTPFGHVGERTLDRLLFARTGRHFNHNIQSVRVLDEIYPLNLTLQTLSGIAGHDGEFEQPVYNPKEISGFDEFDKQTERCIKDKAEVKKLVPSTLEGCVVRISDMIAYLGKDRQDAERAHLIEKNTFSNCGIGTINAEILNNLMVNLIENSYGKPYIMLDEKHFAALKQVKHENYERIYFNETVSREVSDTIVPMMERVYDKLLYDLDNGITSSPVFHHHIDYINSYYYPNRTPYEEYPHEVIVTDYIASMTDDYFVDIYSYLFPNEENKIKYYGYFE